MRIYEVYVFSLYTFFWVKFQTVFKILILIRFSVL